MPTDVFDPRTAAWLPATMPWTAVPDPLFWKSAVAAVVAEVRPVWSTPESMLVP
jgi:hypothetical protein